MLYICIFSNKFDLKQTIRVLHNINNYFVNIDNYLVNIDKCVAKIDKNIVKIDNYLVICPF